jgi:hypothetical protein
VAGDVLAAILAVVRSELERYPERMPVDIVSQAEEKIREAFGGQKVHICKQSKVAALRRIARLANLSTQQIHEVTGYSHSYIRELRLLLKQDPADFQDE